MAEIAEWSGGLGLSLCSSSEGQSEGEKEITSGESQSRNGCWMMQAVCHRLFHNSGQHPHRLSTHASSKSRGSLIYGASFACVLLLRLFGIQMAGLVCGELLAVPPLKMC